MEQCRKAGKSHWYHETQSTMSSQTTLSLMPEAAYVNDRFLLDLAVSETALAPFESWLKPARQLADILFPRTVLNDRLHTFSAYERMSTALTAAQAFGVQRLCRHYAARLAPLPGPDASRESNQRLAQITQYARQLAGSPSVINTRAREQLAEVGLTARDTVLINQIIGFVGFQARVAAIFQAFCRLPVRELPGQEMQRFARAALFQNPQATWRPRRQSGRISPSPYQSSATIFVFTMPNDGAGTPARSVFIRVTRTHTDQHITPRVAPFFTSTYHAPHITYQRQRRLL
ncbi:putative cytoplasmic protein [Salmonella enterica subsp. salamae serovar Greenside]|nr:putative cytoplasmic protein [Salmonella enterica subsp. salamae serovar Greenside]